MLILQISSASLPRSSVFQFISVYLVVLRHTRSSLFIILKSAHLCLSDSTSDARDDTEVPDARLQRTRARQLESELAQKLVWVSDRRRQQIGGERAEVPEQSAFEDQVAAHFILW